MEPIQIAVCDDDKNILELITGATKQVLADMKVPCAVECFCSVAPLKKRMKQKQFNLLLLDVDMPDEDGIHFGIAVKTQANSPDIIYISQCENRVYESFLARPIGFVRKQYFLSDMSNIMKLYVSTLRRKKTQTVCVKTRDGFLNVDAGDIIYVESWLNKQEMHLKSRKEPVELNSKMATLEEMLMTLNFIRIHKSYIVNYRYIARLDRTSVTLSDGTELPLAQRRYKEVCSEYIKLMRTKSAVLIDSK